MHYVDFMDDTVTGYSKACTSYGSVTLIMCLVCYVAELETSDSIQNQLESTLSAK